MKAIKIFVHYFTPSNEYVFVDISVDTRQIYGYTGNIEPVIK